ncbi:TolC family outer membrane protein [Chitinilyticum piscinae]|uniref:TolC family outer membrane protein n=1 Tax=Chitinilyticum piscinae TaxID=2866724 RepID=A0A8J7FH19_9NEIS|nr:TolC family outer membrane protein [Chitinilyticum piscinae]MBE9608040.1 TolC family outer membrane protein [Chitinilyticum piscinae]
MKIKTLAWLCGLALGGALLAESAVAETLRSATERAILNNPDVKARWYDFQASRDEIGVARGRYLPQVNLQAYAGQETQSRPKQDRNSFSHPGASIELRQMLFDGFAVQNEVRSLGYAQLSKYYELLASSDEVAQLVAKAYYDVLRYRELEKLARGNYAVHRELYDQIEERVKAGVGRRVDLEQAAGRLALAESNWLVQKANLQDVSTRYTRLVGTPPAGDLEPAPNLAKELPASAELLNTAIRQSPSFLAAVYNVRASRARAEVQKSGYWPQVEFRASQGLDQNRDGIDGDYKDGVVQVVLNYNLFRGGADRARVNQYSNQLNSAYEMRDRICRDVRQSTVIAWNDVNRLTEQLRYQEQHALSTAKAREAYQRQYDIGQRSLLDLLDSENELFTARMSVVNSQYDQLFAQVRVLGISNRLLPVLQLQPLEPQAPEQDLGGAQENDMEITCAVPLPDEVTLDRAAAMAERPPRAADPLLTAAGEGKSAEPAADKAVLDAVTAWAAAWSAKDAGKYLDSYAGQFKPEQGSRADWEKQRRQRIEKAGTISVKVEAPVVKKLDDKTAEVSFSQSYQSDSYRDQVQKVLTLSREDGKWKIIREAVR